MTASGTSIVLVGSDQPSPGGGRLWRAVKGEPAYLRVLVCKDGEVPDPASFGPGVSVWTGVQIDELVPAGDPDGAGALLAVGQEPEPGYEEPFNAWMDTEHVPSLGGVAGTLSAHRYHSEEGEPAYYAVYHLRDTDVRSTPEWKRAGNSELGDQMRPHARKRTHGLYVPAE